MRKSQMLSELRELVSDLLSCQAAGAGAGILVRNQGLVDGYMLALLQSGVVGKQELLTLVGQERAISGGPATSRARDAGTAPNAQTQRGVAA